MGGAGMLLTFDASLMVAYDLAGASDSREAIRAFLTARMPAVRMPAVSVILWRRNPYQH